jgi:cytochrome c oxidase subunit II
MPADFRLRRHLPAALTVALAVLLTACAQNPNSVFHHRTDFNRDVDSLFRLLIWLGTIVFIFTEVMLVIALVKFRHRPEAPRTPEQTHGNTRLEILWTVIPAVVLAIIAVPTVQTIFKTQAPAPADALEVEVVGHQWWWEFRYPQYKITTANELYLPIGRTVNFALETHDVLHSFWIPGLGGKRDLVNNRTNHLWMTPDSTSEAAFNGFCAEYCGMSHANMRFRAFTVTPEEFASWIAHQQLTASNPLAAATPPAGTTTAAAAPARTGRTAVRTAPPATAANTMPAPFPVQAGFVSFAREQMPNHTVPHTPIPGDLRIDTTFVGDATRGGQIVATNTCIACHTIRGVPTMLGQTGPDLTHVASRLTIAGGLFPNDRQHLTAWVKNARKMKPGVFMTTQGKGEYDPVQKITLSIGLTDQQIADVVAYLQSLK